MRNTLYLFILSGLLAACNGEPGGVIRDQVIAAVSVISRDSPMYGCESCKNA